MSAKLYALLLEDIHKDAEILKEILSNEGFDVRMDLAGTATEYVACLGKNNYDVIFADYTLPGFNGEEALKYAKDICPGVPFIFVSGTIGEDKAVELLKQGATDYVLKNRMERLTFATKRALDAAVQLSKFRQTEIELQTNRRLLQTIINNALDAIYIKDMNGRYLLFNDAAEKAIGKSSSQVIGKDDTYLYSADEARFTMDIDKKVIKTGVPVTYEESLTLIDGNVHIFHTIKCPMFDDNFKPSGLFGIARDITERKQMEHNLSIAKDKAEESDRLKTAFLQNISHEIRTPMNAIIGFTGILSEQELTPKERRNFSDIISRSCNQLLSVISDIISIATIDAGQETIVEKKLEINAMLLSIREEFSFLAKKKDISLNLTQTLKNGENLIVTDQTKLTQVLNNLIGNALKFTKQGHVNFGCAKKDNEIEFFVEDTGIGIPPEMYEEIFKRFRQVEIAAAREYSGSGLGLSISKAIVELLGGKIWLKSEVKKGSTFYFTIPYKK